MRIFGGITGRAQSYGYSNARVKAMKAALLPRDATEEMLSAAGVGGVSAVLDRTDYKEDFAEPGLKYSGADLVEFALSRNLARRARKVLAFTPKEARPAVLSVLEKWDAYNLKTILLAKHLGHAPDDVAPFLVPAGAFTPITLKRILERGSVEEAVEFIGRTSYGIALRPLLPEYRKSRNILPLLNAIEKSFYGRLSGSIPAGLPDSGRILELVRTEIDNRNIMNILRGKRDGASDREIKSYLISGGSLRPNFLKQLLQAKTLEDAVKAVGEKYRLEAELASFREGKSLTGIEDALGRRVIALGLKALRHCILSPGAIVGYIYLKENEMLNIRKIVRGKEFNVPVDKLRDTLVAIG